MGLEAHIHELSEKHRNLDRMISEEMARPGGSDVRIAQLKREKLRLKDLITQLKAEQEVVN